MGKRRRVCLFLAMLGDVYWCILCETLFETICIKDVWTRCLIYDEPSRMQLQLPARERVHCSSERHKRRDT